MCVCVCLIVESSKTNVATSFLHLIPVSDLIYFRDLYRKVSVTRDQLTRIKEIYRFPQKAIKNLFLLWWTDVCHTYIISKNMFTILNHSWRLPHLSKCPRIYIWTDFSGGTAVIYFDFSVNNKRIFHSFQFNFFLWRWVDNQGHCRGQSGWKSPN